NVFIAPPLSSSLTNWVVYSNGDTIPANGNNILEMNTIMEPDSGFYNASICANYQNCNADTAMKLVFGWDCNGFPMAASDTVCFKDSVQIKLKTLPVNASPNTYAPSHTFDLCTPFVFGASYQMKSQQSIYPQQFYIDSTFVGMTIDSVFMFKCGTTNDSVALIPTSSPYLWNITAATLDSIGIADSSLALSECILIKVFTTPKCGTDSVLNLPELNLFSLKYCGDSVTTTAKFDSVGTAINWSGVSNCTNCFTLTKTALQDTVAVGDTATFQIIICGNNADTEIVNLTEYLPANFDTLSGSVIPATDTLYGQQCDTILVRGVFNTSGSCPDLAFTNIIQISNAFIDTTASACINVIPSVQPCITLADTIIPNGAFSSSYGAGVGLTGITIYIADTFFINTYFTLTNCTVYAAPGAIIIKMGGATLILDSTTISGCTTMWRGIHVYADRGLIEQNHSSIRDAEYGVFAEDRTTIMIMNSDITDCITGLYIPPNLSGMNNVPLTIYGSSFGLYSASFKPNFTGQTPHGLMPRSGIEVNDEKATIGDYSFAQNTFNNLNTGITGIRSILTVQNSEFGKIKVDNFYPFGFNGTAIADTGKKSDLTVYQVSSGNTIHDSYRGIYTDQSNLLALRLSIINVNTGVYSEHCNNSSTTTVYECNIDCKRWGIRWENNTGTGGMNAELNTITIHHSRRAAISMSETSNANVVAYTINNNIIYADSTGDGIHALNIYQPSITNNQVYISGEPDTLYTRGIRLNACTGATVTCNTVIGPYPIHRHNRAIVTTISDNCTIACNYIDSTNYGFFFGGICTKTHFKGNFINSHYTGLYLNSAAVIDQQPPSQAPPWHGNTWLDTLQYTSGFGAVNFNDSSQFNLAASVFSTYQYNAAYNPKIPLDTAAVPFHVNDLGWFFVFP
ncbi:MAG: right-handed parallel beta-helix repeat-containing protein, partial [Bacteroidota bacterium]